VRLLLDTHALLWWLGGDARLGTRARALIADEANAVFVSAASAWEIATRARVGELPDAVRLAQEFREHLDQQGFSALEITLEHGQRAGLLPGPTRDPFDRILVAQSQAENLILVSNKAVFDLYGVVRLWD